MTAVSCTYKSGSFTGSGLCDLTHSLKIFVLEILHILSFQMLFCRQDKLEQCCYNYRCDLRSVNLYLCDFSFLLFFLMMVNVTETSKYILLVLYMIATIGDLISRLPPQDRQIVRRIERAERKLINAKHAVQFNKTCLSEQLLPTFSNIRLHDPALREEQFTIEFWVKLVERQLREKEVRVKELESEKAIAYSAYGRLDTNSDLRSDIANALHETVKNYNEVVSTRIAKKLNGLYGGKVCLPNKTDSYLNLSSKALTEDQKDFLNLGLNFHLQTKYSRA